MHATKCLALRKSESLSYGNTCIVLLVDIHTARYNYY